MPHHDILATIHTPVTADGATIKNSFGVVIATMTFGQGDPWQAQALADLINLGVPAARARNEAEAAKEATLRRMLNTSIAPDNFRAG